MSRKLFKYALLLASGLGLLFSDLPEPTIPASPTTFSPSAAPWPTLARRARPPLPRPSAPLAGRTAYAGTRLSSSRSALFNPRTAQRATNHRLIYGLLFGLILGWTWRTYRLVGRGEIPESVVE
ncbi:MAG: hypothetical protein HY696_11230 [Deltaproteobacteria bacterium]|nr:hypothetical protein [Deltaproteobacteria bacterium]